MRDELLGHDIKLKEGQYILVEDEQEILSDEKYQLLFEKAIESIIVIQNQEIKTANPMARELTGYTAKELLSMPFLDLISPQDSLRVIVFLKKRLMGQETKDRLQFRIIRKNGEVRWVEFDVLKILWNNHSATLNFMDDITDRKKAEDKLRRSEEKYRLIAEDASDVLWVFNLAKKRFTYISSGIKAQTGFTPNEAMHKTLKESLTPESFIKLSDAFEKNLNEFKKDQKNPENNIIEIQQPCKDGSTIWIEISTKYRVNPDGEIEVVGVSRDIQKRKKAQEDTLTLSYFDQLTGIYNRSYYEQEVTRLNTKEKCPVTLIIAQVNGLKTANEAFGFETGDQLLVTTANIMKNASRLDDSVTRMSGDEFVLLLPQTNAAVAELIVNRMKDVINKTKLDDVVLKVSFGWATKNNPEEHLEDTFIVAQDMLKRVKKQTHKNRSSD